MDTIVFTLFIIYLTKAMYTNDYRDISLLNLITLTCMNFRYNFMNKV